MSLGFEKVDELFRKEPAFDFWVLRDFYRSNAMRSKWIGHPNLAARATLNRLPSRYSR
jgi:hypothetical protein